MDAASGPVESGKMTAAVAFDFPVSDVSTAGSASPAGKVPWRIRRRMMESGRGGTTCTAEEIDARLRDADLRRQQFHEWLSSKARQKPRSPSWSSQDEDLGQRLEAKLYAAEQKRLSLLTKAQVRLARLDELRQAAKTDVELRLEKEREKLGTRVEYRVQQAEANRMLLLKANLQRKAALRERTARSLLQKTTKENKYKERVRAAICQKRAAAEKKRLRLLEAEKKRAHTRVMRARRVAKFVCQQREVERRRMKEQLEERLQRAKQQRAEFLRQRGSPQSSNRINWNKIQKHGDLLSRKLLRCWRQFVKSRGTTLTLAKAYEALGINTKLIRCMPFEQLAVRIESASTLRAVKALLDRLESRFILSQSSNPSGPENLDPLLKRLGSPNRRGSSSKAPRSRGQTKRGSKDSKSREPQKLSRYAVRVVLCAYMILGHPDAVFSGQGERENELAESAANFIQEFELLIKMVLSCPSSPCLLAEPLVEGISDDQGDQLPIRHSFRSQLATFDAAWHSYLYRFVVWKDKDARLLEDDLVRAACHLELSMMQTCKLTSDGHGGPFTHDMKAVQKQVTEDQRLLCEKVKHLSGNAGVERMETALSDTRSKYFEAKENGNVTPVSHILSPVTPTIADPSTSLSERTVSSEIMKRSSSAVRSLFKDASPSSPQSKSDISMKDAHPSTEPVAFGNELSVNEFLHDNHYPFSDSPEAGDEDESLVKAKIKEIMEKAFWDGVMESFKRDHPDHGRLVALVTEIRDELCEMTPKNWKEEIHNSIDVEILTQILQSGSHDMDYLGNILEYALSMLRKLSAPAKGNEMKVAHQKLLTELSDIAHSFEKLNNSFFIAIAKALKFVLEQIQTLKKEISRARIQMMVPIITGPVGLEYLQNAFGSRHGPPSDVRENLPSTAQWISSLLNSFEEWAEHTESLSTSSTSQVLPRATALRSGGRILLSSSSLSPSSDASASHSNEEESECNGEKIDVLLRLGLLKLVMGKEGLTKETLPETFILNFSRLRAVQGNLQNTIVISTSVLVLRQILLSERTVEGARSQDVESLVSESVKSLCQILLSERTVEGARSQDVGIAEIIDTIISASSEIKLEEKKEVMARVLIKSLQAGDTVCERVYRSIYLAARGIVLGGRGDRGRSLADAALRRVGAYMLVDKLVDVVEKLIVMAKVSREVHRPWYEELVHN